MNQNPPFPTPEELQAKLSEFMKSNFGDKVSFATFAQPERVEEGEDEKPVPQTSDHFVFDFLPRDIKAHLDRFVIKQDEAKKVLSIAVCDHYNHVNYLRHLKSEDAVRAEETEYAKQNVILVGPTGVGKTYLIKHIAELIKVPFVKADATKFSETGYVGGDVEDLVRELVQKADGDVALAQFGIIYIDEVDKLASASNMVGRDVSGRGVQTTLLKLMEETEVPLRSANDLQGQLQAAFEFQKRGKTKRETISTRHILFVVSGAFERLKTQVSKRLAQGQIGFSAESVTVLDNEIFQHVGTQDFIEYGFEPEFIGRLPVRVVCEELTADDLYRIMKYSEGSILRQYERAFRAYGIEVSFEDEALLLMANAAALEKTGARGLLTVWEKLFRDYKYYLAGSGLTQLRVTEELVREPQLVLERLMAEGEHHEKETLKHEAQMFTDRFSREHGVELQFDDSALRRLVERAIAERMKMSDLCAHLFKDFQFGLSLIKKNTGKNSFVLDEAAIEAPDKFLSQLVLKILRSGRRSPGRMKRALLGTLWIGAIAAGLAIALQISGLLARPASALGKAIALSPNGAVGFWNFLFLILLSFSVAWTMLQVTGVARRAGLFALLILELLGAAWVLHAAHVSFPPLPAILAATGATLLAFGLNGTRASRQRSATAQAFTGRLAQTGIDRLTKGEPLNLFEPSAREASFVYCEIANEADLIDDLPPAVCAQVTREFIECARKRFLQDGGYLQAADGEGIRVLFGFPVNSPQHACEAARAALAFREEFHAAAAARPDSLGKVDLRIGISSGTVVAAMREESGRHEIVIAGEPFEVARRLARANQIYGSEILLGPRTFSAAGKAIVARPIDFLRSAEAHDRLEVYELLTLAEKASAEEIARRDRFWTAIVYFRERRWNEAFAEFNRARADNGAPDEPLEWYLRQLESLRQRMAVAEPAPVAEPLVRL